MAIDYFINGVWKDAQDRITHVSLCKNDLIKNVWYGGKKTSESEVIKIIEAGNLIYTKVFHYPDWKNGAKVEVFHTNGKKFLRTVANATTKDNLDNSINMFGFSSL